MKKTGHVLFLMQDVSGGGAEVAALNVVHGIILSGRNARIHLFSKNHIDLSLPESLFLKNRSIFAAEGGQAMSLLESVKYASVIIGSLEIKTHIAAMLLGKFFRKPVILWLHKDLVPFLQSKNFFKNWCYKKLFFLNLQCSQQVICVSYGVANNLSSIFPKQAKKISCIYNALNLENIDRKRAQDMDILPLIKKKFVLAVGRLSYEKGFDLLLKAFFCISKKIKNIDLLILGDGPERQSLKRISQCLGIQDHVHMPGFMSPYSAMASASLFVMPSRFEGLSMVLIEALYQGVKIVSMDCPSGPREVLCNGEYGILVKNGSINELAHAMLFSLMTADTEEKRIKRKERAREFSFKNIIPQWEYIIDQVSKSH